MPLINGSDAKGRYFKYGNSGRKYYYKARNVKSRYIAKQKAMRQGHAIEMRRRKSKGGMFNRQLYDNVYNAIDDIIKDILPEKRDRRNEMTLAKIITHNFNDKNLLQNIPRLVDRYYPISYDRERIKISLLDYLDASDQNSGEEPIYNKFIYGENEFGTN
jgi:hypothetical protein